MKTAYKLNVLAAGLGLVICGAALAQAPSPDAVLQAVIKKHPTREKPRSVASTPVPGIYEVLVGDQIVYTDATATYFFVGGQMVDLAKNVNLTDKRKSELLKVDVSKLERSDAIVVTKGKPTSSRTLIVFSDPMCPFCHRLEAELEKMNDIEVRTYLIPRPQAKGLTESIWCAKDPGLAWSNYMLKRAEPVSGQCSNPLEKIGAFAKAHGINGTPTLLTLDGRRTSGYMPVDGIEAFLTNR